MLPNMGRPLRYTYAGAYHHVSVRCNNREFQFIGTRGVIESMASRFGGRLRVSRTEMRPLGRGVMSLGLDGRGGHRTSKLPRRSTADDAGPPPGSAWAIATSAAEF